MAIQHALVVDDSKSARLILRRMLEKTGLSVDAVETAEEAMDFLRLRRPDVIFMDHMLPGMSGLEALERIRHNPSTVDVPVLMCTSTDTEDYRGQAKCAGAAGILTKPATADEIGRLLVEIEQGCAVAAPGVPLAEHAATAPTATVVTPAPVAPAPVIQGPSIEEILARVEEMLASRIGAAVSTCLDGEVGLRLDRMEQALAQGESGLRQRVEQGVCDEVGRAVAGVRQEIEQRFGRVDALVSKAQESARTSLEGFGTELERTLRAKLGSDLDTRERAFAERMEAQFSGMAKRAWLAVAAASASAGAAIVAFILA